MDNMQLCEEVNALRKLDEEYERQLKLLGFELCDLPDDCAALLNECVELKMATKLHDLRLTYLEEYYYIKKKEQIDNFLITSKLSSDIKQLEEQIEAEASECNELQKFSTSVSKRLVSDAEMERHKIQIQNEIKNMTERQKSFRAPDDINIDDLIKKIEILENRKNSQKEK